jgi:hypothetical protein
MAELYQINGVFARLLSSFRKSWKTTKTVRTTLRIDIISNQGLIAITILISGENVIIYHHYNTGAKLIGLPKVLREKEFSFYVEKSLKSNEYFLRYLSISQEL